MGVMDNVLDSLKDQYGATLQHEKQTSAAEDAAVKSLDDVMATPPPPVPDMPALPPPPQAKTTSPMEAFGSAASAFAIFGSLLTRHPLTSALHASAAAMNAIHANDAAAYSSAYDAWKTNTDYAIKMGEYQQKRYQQILDNRTADVNEKLAYLKAIFAQDQNWQGLHATETGDLKAVADTVYKQQALLKRLNGSAEKIGSDAWLMQQFILDYAKTHNNQMPSPQAMMDFKRSGTVAAQNAADKKNQTNATFDSADGLIDGLEKQLQSSDWVAGGRGIVMRPIEGVRGLIDPNYQSKSAAFESDLTSLQNALAQLGHTRQATKQQIERMDTIIRGLGVWDNKGTVLKSLDDAKKLLGELRGQPVKTGGEAGASGDSGDSGDVGPFYATMPDGSPIHSDDGETWFDKDGNLVPND